MENSSSSLKVKTSIRAILALAVPISISKLIPEVNYLINASFVGHLGTVELAVVGIVGVYYLIFAAIGYGLNSALLSIMSRKAGEENKEEMASMLAHGMVIAIILALIAIGITWLWFGPLLQVLHLDNQVIALATSFINVRIIGLIFLFALNAQISYVISLQRTRFLVWIAFIESAVNVFLDYGLIFGHFGLPELGFVGAAYASVAAEVIGLLAVWIILSQFIGEKISFRYLSLNNLKLVFSQGFPLMSQYAISTGSWWVFFLLISRQYTVSEQAISQVMRNFFGLSGIFTWSFGSVTNTIISNLIGQGKSELIFTILKKIQTISLVGVCIYIIGINFFSEEFLSIFGQDAIFMDEAKLLLGVVSMAIIIQTFGVIWLNGVVATGMTKVVFWIEFVGIFMYMLYIFIVIDRLALPFPLAWMSEWLYWTVMMAMSIWYLRRGDWQKGLKIY